MTSATQLCSGPAWGRARSPLPLLRSLFPRCGAGSEAVAPERWPCAAPELGGALECSSSSDVAALSCGAHSNEPLLDPPRCGLVATHAHTRTHSCMPSMGRQPHRGCCATLPRPCARTRTRTRCTPACIRALRAPRRFRTRSRHRPRLLPARGGESWGRQPGRGQRQEPSPSPWSPSRTP